MRVRAVQVRAWLRRPVSLGYVLLGYVGVFVALGFGVSAAHDVNTETAIRQHDMCQVVVNVHENAKFRAATEANRVSQTKAYLADPRSPRDQLYKRVQENLASIKSDLAVAEANVEATTVPESCRTLNLNSTN